MDVFVIDIVGIHAVILSTNNAAWGGWEILDTTVAIYV